MLDQLNALINSIDARFEPVNACAQAQLQLAQIAFQFADVGLGRDVFLDRIEDLRGNAFSRRSVDLGFGERIGQR